MKDKLDYEAIAAIALEINKRIKLIKDLFPEDKEPLLNNLAAAAIHIATFMMDIFEDKEGLESSSVKSKSFKEFLKKCGCLDEQS